MYLTGVRTQAAIISLSRGIQTMQKHFPHVGCCCEIFCVIIHCLNTLQDTSLLHYVTYHQRRL